MLSGNTLVATVFHKPMSRGRNGALHLSAEADDGTTVDCVVKIRSRMEGGARAFAAEWISAYIAQQIGLRVPTPYLVEITKPFADSVTDVTAGPALRASVGAAFGSEVIVGMQPLSAYASLPEGLVPFCGEVLGCDNYIVNPDRREGPNPNLALVAGEFVLFDHDLALSWKLAIPAVKPESADIPCVQQHVLRRSLAGRKDGLAGFRAALNRLTRQRLDEIVGTLPADWRQQVGDNEVRDILSFLGARLERADAWTAEVERWLESQSPLMLQ